MGQTWHTAAPESGLVPLPFFSRQLPRTCRPQLVPYDGFIQGGARIPARGAAEHSKDVAPLADEHLGLVARALNHFLRLG